MTIANGSLYEIWVNTDQELAAPLWFIIADAMRLLRSHQLTRLKKCPGCGSMYIDTTKNNIRNWCNPMVCGKRIRNRKYYKGKVLGEKG